MLEITYWELCAAITIAWVIIRAIVGIKNKRYLFSGSTINDGVYMYHCNCRIVNFPWHHVMGKLEL